MNVKGWVFIILNIERLTKMTSAFISNLISQKNLLIWYGTNNVSAILCLTVTRRTFSMSWDYISYGTFNIFQGKKLSCLRYVIKTRPRMGILDHSKGASPVQDWLLNLMTSERKSHQLIKVYYLTPSCLLNKLTCLARRSLVHWKRQVIMILAVVLFTV